MTQTPEPTAEVVAVVAAQAAELRGLVRRLGEPRRGRLGRCRTWSGALAGRRVVLAATGEGRRAAAEGVEALLEAHTVSCLLTVGVAGALSPSLNAGDVVIGTSVETEEGSRRELSIQQYGEDVLPTCARARSGRILTVDRIVCDVDEKERLWKTMSSPDVAVVDMETWDFVQAVEASGIEACAVRVVSDTAAEALPRWMNECRLPDGRISRAAVARRCLIAPSEGRRMLRLGRRVSAASDRIGTHVEMFLDGV